METHLFIGTNLLIFLIFFAFILRTDKISNNYSKSSLLLSLNALFYSIILLFVAHYSDIIKYTIISVNTLLDLHFILGQE